MDERIYTINELRRLIEESSSDFNAKIGDGVTSNNKKTNNSSYKEAKKRAKNFDGGGEEAKENRQLSDKEDGNKTTLDYELEANCGDNFREKVKAQAEGYTSTLEKKNKIEKTADFSDKTYKQFTNAAKKISQNKVDAKHSGLTARTLPKSAFEKEKMYKESKKLAVINFKNTTFINESQMVSRIPDDYKFEGNRFKVKDAGENEFIVEWKEGEANILSYENKKKLNESIEKFHKLTGYKSQNQFKTSTPRTRINETTEFNRILDTARIIADKN